MTPPPLSSSAVKVEEPTARGSGFLLGTLPSGPRAQRMVPLVFLYLAFLHETSESFKPHQPAPYLVPAGKVWFGTAAGGENITKPLRFLVRFIPSFLSILRWRRRERCLHQPHAATDSGDGPTVPCCAPRIKKVSVTQIAADLQKLFYIMVTALYLLTYNNRVITTIFKNKTMKSY